MRFVLLLVAVVIAVAVGIAVLQFSSKSGPAPVQATAARPAEVQNNVNTVDVLVAKTPIAIGTVIDSSMIDKQPWPEHLVLDGFIVSDGKEDRVSGKVARATFQPHEPLMLSKLANPNDPSFLAASLPTGMRAVTMATDTISGIAGYVYPGDRVDVVFTHNVPTELKDAFKEESGVTGLLGVRQKKKPAFAEVLIPNVRVLAVNIRQVTARETQQSVVPSSITLEVNEADAQRLRLAEKNGTLALSLRSLKDIKNASVPEPALLQNLSVIHMEDQEQTKIKIVRGVTKDSDGAVMPSEPLVQMFKALSNNPVSSVNGAQDAPLPVQNGDNIPVIPAGN